MSDFNSPKDLLNAYRKGFNGAICDPEETATLLGELKTPLFGAAAYRLYGSGEGKLSLPYKSLLKFDPKFGASERQTTGDCFVKGTQILMSDGDIKNIEDIQIGETVITHNNRSKNVYELINKQPTEQQINHIYIKKYDKTISVTNDHKLLVFTDSGYEWIETTNLKEGDLLVLPKFNSQDKGDDKVLDLCSYLSDLEYTASDTNVRVKHSKNTLARFIRLSTDLMWLFGLYAAEGGIDGTNKERITFNLHIKETELRDRIISLFSNIFGVQCTILNRASKNVCCVRCSNIVISRLFVNFVDGNQWSKVLNRQILNSSKYHRIAFLRGWSDGDGSVTTEKRRKLVGVSVSKTLIQNISEILVSLQIQHTVSTRQPRNRSKEAYQVNLYGDQVYKIYPELSVMTKVHSKQNSLTCSLGLLAPITSIKNEPYTDNVYCINVEDDHSFIANGIISHNCVSHATRNGVDVTRAVEIDIKGESESFEARSATEGIYQSRTNSGQGMTCSNAAKYVSTQGGILLRKNYGAIDLSTYNSTIGANKTIPQSIWINEAKKHQVKTISMITTVQEARDALANGYAISVCSGYGFSSKRDGNGIAERSSGWNHAMAWIACDDTKSKFKEMLFLVQNSWGVWNSGPRVHDQPEGSFWIREKDARGMLAEQGSWVFSNVDGFPAKDLPDYGTSSFL
jgi:intein/homing endonuclease